MQRNLSLILILTITCFYSGACKTKQAAPTNLQNDAPGPVATDPARVLLRTADNCNCAADGYLWLAQLGFWEVKKLVAENKAAAEKAANKDENRAEGENVGFEELMTLSSGNGITVTKESIDDEEPTKQKRAKGQSPGSKADLKNFDFLVTWNLEYKELTKRSLNEPLQITAKETLRVEKISDTSVTKTWSFTYLLNAGSNIDAYEKTASQQNETVVIPARGPVLKEIRVFILNNMRM